jgi:hypothetical protein
MAVLDPRAGKDRRCAARELTFGRMHQVSLDKLWLLTPYGARGHCERVMKAELLFHQRVDYDDGGIVEMVLWRVPTPVAPSTHGLKYSLFYGHPGIREVGYDNERGKGDHRHFQGAETKYVFSSVEQLMVDFWSDVRTLRGGK